MTFPVFFGVLKTYFQAQPETLFPLWCALGFYFFLTMSLTTGRKGHFAVISSVKYS
jgi:hypothetical protein